MPGKCVAASVMRCVGKIYALLFVTTLHFASNFTLESVTILPRADMRAKRVALLFDLA